MGLWSLAVCWVCVFNIAFRGLIILFRRFFYIFVYFGEESCRFVILGFRFLEIWGGDCRGFWIWRWYNLSFWRKLMGLMNGLRWSRSYCLFFFVWSKGGC